VAAKATVDQWVYPYFLFAKGLVDYRQGRFESAISIMNGDAANVMGPAPRLVVAMAEHRQGYKQEARQTLAATISGFDWSAANVGGRDDWIWHVLRREAETLIFPHTADLLEGRYEPQDSFERLALTGVCRFKNLNLASAQLYADAFAADPLLADDPQVNHCYNAARAAALAGCGSGEERTALTQAERARWRKQARAWLQADLAAWCKKLDSNAPREDDHVTKTLARWQADPDLAGLRDATAVDKLSGDERKECLGLWKEVGNLLHRARERK
jgi:serine/threonine-protein kinase